MIIFTRDARVVTGCTCYTDSVSLRLYELNGSFVDEEDGVEARNVLTNDGDARNKDEREAEDGRLLTALCCREIRWYQHNEHEEGC